ncbi:SpoIIE family protein phosphatase [Leptospira sp. WS92.C1]
MLFFLILISGCNPQPHPVFPKESTIDLSGSWEIYDDSIAEIPPKPFNPELWKPLSIPSNLKGRIKTHSENWILLRKRFAHSESKLGFQSLCLGKISDQAKVYLNGKELREELFSSYQTSVPQGYDRNRIYSVSSEIFREQNEIEVYLKPYFEYEFGILSGPILIGPAASILKTVYRDEIVGLLIFTSFLVIASFFLFLYWKEKRGRENLYFGLFLLFFSLYQLSLSDFKYFTGLNILYLKKIEYSILSILFPIFCRFLLPLFRKAKTRIHFLLEISSLFFLFGFWFAQTVFQLDWINRYGLQISWIGYVYLSFKILLPSLKKNLESRLILSGILFLGFCIFVDILSERGVLKTIRISGIGVIGFLFFLTLILAGKFVRMKEKLRSWNFTLEKSIVDRTKALSQSLKEIQDLKEHQDGDYFLISLLFQPFLSKNIQHRYGNIDIHRKQYKKFQFKNRTYEIGGDVVLTEEVLISGIRYQVLINADAMGKSLQGASGALVFCSIVKSFLQTSDYEFRSPENWLFLLYKNLQAVFESFDGSMLISAILALYNFETGDLFFLNCEHPPMILIRNGKTSYLKENVFLKKIGFPDSESTSITTVEFFQVRPGDSILFGSDGKEDLYIQESLCSSRKQKSSVPEVFFDLVKHPISSLKDLEIRLEEKGELSDDLSFLRIQASSVERSEIFLSQCRSFLKTGNESFQKGEFRRASRCYARASVLNPGDLNLAKLTLMSARKCDQLRLVRFFSEKILLRTQGVPSRFASKSFSQPFPPSNSEILLEKKGA